MTMKMVGKGLIACALLAACGTEDGATRIEVSERNHLGVVSLDTERLTEGGNDVFLLRAFTADDQERAFVRLTKGSIPELAQLLPGDDIGAELVLSVDGVESKIVTRETSYLEISPDAFKNPEAAELFTLPTVSETLLREANIVRATRPQAGGEVPQWTTNCSQNLLYTTPTARECCWDGTRTAFHRDDEAIVSRAFGAGACKSYSGGSCSGVDCYYGPLGAAAPQLSTPPAGYYAHIYKLYPGMSSEACGSDFLNYNAPYQFYDWPGSNPRTLGCCVNGAGVCGGSYQACTSCGGGGAAGVGKWLY
jgi:hypothetical protein